MCLRPYSSRDSFTWPTGRRSQPFGVWLAAFALLLLAGCGPARSPESGSTRPVDPVDILVQGAEMTELGPLLEALEAKQEHHIGTWHFWRGRLRGKSAVVSLTEVGPMNATAATVLAIERWNPRVIVNQGTAGAHDPQLQVRDIVFGVRNVEFNAFKTQPARDGEGVSLQRVVPSTTKMRIGKLDHRVGFAMFPSHPQLLEQALAVKYAKGRLIRGVVGSGHQWNREIDRIEWLRATYNSDVEDMESAYVAAVAYAFQVPFLSVRIVSDSEFHSPEFIRETGSDCARFVLDLIDSLDLKQLKAVSHQHLPADATPATP
jgi:adenosylhomocysteine nucleosidase